MHSHMLLRVKNLTLRPRPLNPSLSRALPSQLTIIIPKYGRLLFREMPLSILLYYILFRLRNPRILDPPDSPTLTAPPSPSYVLFKGSLDLVVCEGFRMPIKTLGRLKIPRRVLLTQTPGKDLSANPGFYGMPFPPIGHLPPRFLPTFVHRP